MFPLVRMFVSYGFQDFKARQDVAIDDRAAHLKPES
jgi:hypothetical protein